MSQFDYNKIIQLLFVAKHQLAYCRYIYDYPEEHGFRGFDNASNKDNFYRDSYNVFFVDSLLRTYSLINKEDSRLISFWGWPNFVKSKEKELTAILDFFKSSGLKTIRDQVVAHQDLENSANKNPTDHIRSFFNVDLISYLDAVHEDMVSVFLEYIKEKRSFPNYALSTFKNEEDHAIAKIKAIMDEAKPKLTNLSLIM